MTERDMELRKKALYRAGVVSMDHLNDIDAADRYLTSWPAWISPTKTSPPVWTKSTANVINRRGGNCSPSPAIS